MGEDNRISYIYKEEYSVCNCVPSEKLGRFSPNFEQARKIMSKGIDYINYKDEEIMGLINIQNVWEFCENYSFSGRLTNDDTSDGNYVQFQAVLEDN